MRHARVIWSIFFSLVVMAVICHGQASVTLSPTSLIFSGQLLNTTSGGKAVTLTNSGTTALAITSIKASGNFTQSNTCSISPSTLAVGAKCTIMVTFTPSVAGGISGEITINDNAVVSPQLVNLSGTGLTSISLSPTSLAFGTLTVGASSTAKTVNLTNNLSTALTIGFSASGDYAAIGSGATPCGSSLAGKAKCTMSVTFKPKSNGSINGAVTITYNSSFSPQEVALSGTGSGGPSSPLTFSPTSLTFTNQLVGTNSTSKTVTVTNITGSSLSISKISASGNFAAAGSGATPCGNSLAAGAKCTMAVSFSPSINGTIKGSVTITDSTTVSPQVYSVSGTGVLAMGVSPLTMTFAAQTVGTASPPKTVTLTNNQSTTLTITGIVASGNYTATPCGTNACGTSLAAHAKCTFSVAFTPSVSRTIKGVVTAAYTGGPFSPLEVKLTGAGSLGGGTLTIVPKTSGAGSVSATVAAYLTKLIADMQPVQRAECGSASGSHTIEIVYDPNQGWHYDENNLIIVMHDLPNPDSSGVDQNFDLSVIHESTHALQTDILRIINGLNLRGTNADVEGFAQSCAYRVSRDLALMGKRKDLTDGGTGSMLQFDLFRSFDPIPIAAGFWSNSVPYAQPERNLGEAAYLLAGSQLGTSGSNAVVEHENALFAVETRATAPLTAQERIQLWDSISANLDRKTLGAWMPSEMIHDPDFQPARLVPQLMAWPIMPQFPAQMVAQALTVTLVDDFNKPTVSPVTSGPLTITVRDATPQHAIALGPIQTDFSATFDTANPYLLDLQNKNVGTYTVIVDATVNGTALHTNFAVANITLSCIGAVSALNVPVNYLVATDASGNAVNGTLTVTRGTSVWPTLCGNPIPGFAIVKPDATGTFDVTGPSGTPHTYTAIDPWARFIPVE